MQDALGGHGTQACRIPRRVLAGVLVMRILRPVRGCRPLCPGLDDLGIGGEIKTSRFCACRHAAWVQLGATVRPITLACQLWSAGPDFSRDARTGRCGLEGLPRTTGILPASRSPEYRT